MISIVIVIVILFVLFVFGILLQNILKIQNSFNPDNKFSNLYIKIRDFLAENKGVIENKIDNSNEKKNISSIKSD